MTKIERRLAKLTKDLKVMHNGIDKFFPMGTVFYNYRPDVDGNDVWDSWFYEYEISGGLGLQLAPNEYVLSPND